MAENETANALAFLGEWLADDVQTPTREEIKLARAVALVLVDRARLLKVLRDRPVTWVCTCGRMNSGPACDFCPRVTTLPEQLLAITASAVEAAPPPSEPPLITTADQLRALPVGTVLLGDAGVAFQSEIIGSQYAFVPATIGGGPFWYRIDGNMADLLQHGPFRVLHTPEVPRG